MLVGGCARGSRNVADIRDLGQAPGSVISVQYLTGYSAITLRILLWRVHLPRHVEVSGGIDLYRIRYWTAVTGKPVAVSGLMSIPRGVSDGRMPRATVMYLHGTSPARAESPSAPGDAEGLLPAAAFAGGGYVLLAPDYEGLGDSTVAPTYLIAEPTSAAARDLLTAAHHASEGLKIQWNPNLYLVGFSQGGQAVAAVHRDLEARPNESVTLRGSVAIAGPFDLDRISIPYAFQHRHTLYLAYIAYCYANYYRHPLSDLVLEPYAR
jgi:pimeloyl-ACP methyl ester carboxylesterase